MSKRKIGFVLAAFFSLLLGLFFYRDTILAAGIEKLLARIFSESAAHAFTYEKVEWEWNKVSLYNVEWSGEEGDLFVEELHFSCAFEMRPFLLKPSVRAVRPALSLNKPAQESSSSFAGVFFSPHIKVKVDIEEGIFAYAGHSFPFSFVSGASLEEVGTLDVAMADLVPLCSLNLRVKERQLLCEGRLEEVDSAHLFPLIEPFFPFLQKEWKGECARVSLAAHVILEEDCSLNEARLFLTVGDVYVEHREEPFAFQAKEIEGDIFLTHSYLLDQMEAHLHIEGIEGAYKEMFFKEGSVHLSLEPSQIPHITLSSLVEYAHQEHLVQAAIFPEQKEEKIFLGLVAEIQDVGNLTCQGVFENQQLQLSFQSPSITCGEMLFEQVEGVFRWERGHLLLEDVRMDAASCTRFPDSILRDIYSGVDLDLSTKTLMFSPLSCTMDMWQLFTSSCTLSVDALQAQQIKEIPLQMALLEEGKEMIEAAFTISTSWEKQEGFHGHFATPELHVKGKNWGLCTLDVQEDQGMWLLHARMREEVLFKGTFFTEKKSVIFPHVEVQWKEGEYTASGKCGKKEGELIYTIETLSSVHPFGEFTLQKPAQVAYSEVQGWRLLTPAQLRSSCGSHLYIDQALFIGDKGSAQLRGMLGSKMLEKFSTMHSESLSKMRKGKPIQVQLKLSVAEGVYEGEGELAGGTYFWNDLSLDMEPIVFRITEERVSMGGKGMFKEQPVYLSFQLDKKESLGMVKIQDHPKQGGIKALFTAREGAFSLETIEGECFGFSPRLYRNNLKNRVLAPSALPQNFDAHSRLALRQWSLAPHQNSEELPCQIPDSSGCFGIYHQKLGESEEFTGRVEIDFSKVFLLLSQEQRSELKDLELGKGYALEGTFSLNPFFFQGTLQGKEFQLLGHQLGCLEAKAEITSSFARLSNAVIEDEGGKFFIKEARFQRHVDAEQWGFEIPTFYVKNLRPSLLKNAQGERAQPKAFVIRNLQLSDLHGFLEDRKSFRGNGRLNFTNGYKKERSFLDVPLDLLKNFGLDVGLLTPIYGEIECHLEEGKCYLTEMRNTYSEGKRSHFFLDGEKEAYIDMKGNIHMDLRMKQEVVLKVTEPFVLTIRGTLKKPEYGLSAP